MTKHHTDRFVSRRTALAGLGATGAGFAIASRPAVAQDAATEMANHPIVGAWNAMTPGGPVINFFFPNGFALMCPQVTQAGPNGVTFVASQPGVWEPVSERGIHFTGIQLHSDADGAYVMSVTIDGYPEVSEDGATIVDDQSRAVVTIRDAGGAILQEIPGAGAPPVTGVRMSVGSPGFPESAAEATPAA